MRDILGDPGNYFLGIPGGISILCSQLVFLIAAEVWGVSEGSLGVGEPELRLLEAS